MSVQTFIGNIFKSIANLFEGLKEDAKQAIHIGVKITDALKSFDDKNPLVADLLTAVIPGDLDDKIKAKLRECMPFILVQLRLAEGGDVNEILLNAIKNLQGLQGDFKKDFLDSLAVQIALVVADGKVTWDELKTITKWYYDTQHKAA